MFISWTLTVSPVVNVLESTEDLRHVLFLCWGSLQAFWGDNVQMSRKTLHSAKGACECHMTWAARCPAIGCWGIKHRLEPRGLSHIPGSLLTCWFSQIIVTSLGFNCVTCKRAQEIMSQGEHLPDMPQDWSDIAPAALLRPGWGAYSLQCKGVLMLRVTKHLPTENRHREEKG